MTRRGWSLVWCVLVLSCGPAAEPDAGMDAGHDSGTDAPTLDDVPTDVPLPACGNGSALELTQCVEAARYQADLEEIAMPREPMSAHWQVVQDLCADRLTSLGFTVERQAYATGVNVVGVRLGTTESNRRVLVAAHYDHIPGCTGADDNASGTAGALEVARVLGMASFPRTLVVACWDEEERGLIGSGAYAARAEAAGETIDAYFNFEMIGFNSNEPDSQTFPAGFDTLFRDAARELEAGGNRANFIAVISDPDAQGNVNSLERFADRIGLPFIPVVVPAGLLSSPLVGDLRRSDHASFWDHGFPAMMITDTSEFRYASYHCRSGEDAVANLNREFTAQVVRMTVGAAAEALGL